MDKLTHGVLQLDTHIGPRYVQPNFVQRVYLLWTFRNFFSLPQQVLRPWELRLVDRLLNENGFVSMSSVGGNRIPIIGRIERQSQSQARAEILPMRKPPHREAVRQPGTVSTSAADRNQEAASA